jgi:hypothetical protein
VTQYFTDGNETWRIHTSVDMEMMKLQKRLKLFLFLLETQADTVLRVGEIVSSQGTNQTGRRQISV